LHRLIRHGAFVIEMTVGIRAARRSLWLPRTTVPRTDSSSAVPLNAVRCSCNVRRSW